MSFHMNPLPAARLDTFCAKSSAVHQKVSSPVCTTLLLLSGTPSKELNSKWELREPSTLSHTAHTTPLMHTWQQSDQSRLTTRLSGRLSPFRVADKSEITSNNCLPNTHHHPPPPPPLRNVSNLQSPSHLQLGSVIGRILLCVWPRMGELYPAVGTRTNPIGRSPRRYLGRTKLPRSHYTNTPTDTCC